ncbi:MAG: GNAT family N-acetyltransferase [Lautropia sp.]
MKLAEVLPPAGALPFVELLPRHDILARSDRIEVRLAADDSEIDAALALRHRVFAIELGAALPGRDGRDRDVFDRHCRHLIALDRDTCCIVGTYRALLPAQARRLGFLYADREFVLSWLNPLRDDLVEVGRACIEPGYRNGIVLMLLWRGIRALVERHGHRYLLGCCSLPADDGGVAAARLYRQLAACHLAPPQLRVWPRHRLPVATRDAASASATPEVAPLPPLLRGYLSAGARILGEPHLDMQFRCADLPILLDLRALSLRLQARFGRDS